MAMCLLFDIVGILLVTYGLAHYSKATSPQHQFQGAMCIVDSEPVVGCSIAAPVL